MNKHHCTHCGEEIKRRVHPSTIRPFCDSTCYGLWQRDRKFAEQGKPVREARVCSIPKCNETHFAHGHCRKHYLLLDYVAPKTPTAFTRKATIACDACGERFIPRHKTARYCSSRCSGAARRRPFIVKKGYRKVLIPSHPRADGKGYVFEHIIVAEAAIGRPLKAGEEIHHKDFNRQNNAASNLIVCATHAEHMRYHATPS